MPALLYVEDRHIWLVAIECNQMAERACATDVLVDVRNVSKTFGQVKALNAVSLTIGANEIFGLLGPNGSGKTTMLRILATLLPPDSRSIRSSAEKVICRVAGHDLFTRSDEVRRTIGYVPQRDCLYGDLSAQDNLIFFSTAYDLADKSQRIGQLLRMAGLYERRNTLVSTFSGGMMKRLSIMCALAHEPPVLLLDEATVGLDAETRRGIWKILEELKTGRAIVVATHYINEAEEHCDRVALLIDGKVVDVGAPTELIGRYPPARNLEEAAAMIQEVHAARRKNKE